MSESTPPSIRVSIVDDDAAFMRDLVAAVEAAEGLSLEKTAINLAQALQLIAGPAPDVLVVDLGLPDGSGIDAIKAAHQAWPACQIMVSTTFADELHVIQSIEAGAGGYLLKDSSPQKLAEDIRSIHSGGSPISPMIARYVLQRFRHGAETAPAAPENDDAPALSARELEVLRLITKGFTYDEISGLMQVSRNTIMTYVRRIYAKLAVKSKAEAIHEAHQRRLVRN